MNSEISRLVDEIKAQGYRKICFSIPAFNVGGGTFYLCELAKYLVENSDLEVYYIDFKDGYPSQLLEGSGVKILEYNKDDIDFPITEPCIFVTNSTRVIQVKHMNPASKLLFWHYETVPCAWDKVLIRNETRAFLELCKQEKAMVFHDWSSRNIFMQQYGIDFTEQKYLYMFLTPKPRLNERLGMIHPGEINLLWLGREGTEKVQSIYTIIRCYAAYKTKKKKIMHIVGDGIRIAELKKYAKGFEKQIKFVFTGTIGKEELDEYLMNHADVSFAMGLSAVESAALKIPSVVVQLDTKPIKDDEFYWIFDTREYCMGILPSQKKDFEVQFTKFNDIMDEIVVRKGKQQMAIKSYAFYKEYLSDYDDIVEKFLTYISETTLTAEKLEKCIGFMPYENIRLKRKKFLRKILSENIEFNGKRYKYNDHGKLVSEKEVRNSGEAQK